MRIAKSIISVALLAWLIPLKADVPDWSVDPHGYLYSMSVTGPVNIDGVECTASDILVGAFVGTECRGVCSLSYSADRYMAFLSIFGNSNGEAIELKAWLPEQDKVLDLSNTLGFEINGTLGTVIHPFILSQPALSSAPVIDSLVFPHQEGATIFLNDSIFTALAYGTPQNALVASFGVPPATKVFADDSPVLSGITPLDYSNPVELDVQSADETRWGHYVVCVSQANARITALDLTENSIDENLPVGSPIGKFGCTDADMDPHEYSLVDGEGASNNGLFYLEDSSLYSNDVFDFETANSYSIRVRTDDHRGSSLEKIFQILVSDRNDAPVIVDQLFALDENSLAGTLAGTITASDEDQGQVLSFRIEEGNTDQSFVLDSLSGQLTVNDPVPLDFEINPNYKLVIITTDNGIPALSDTAMISITVNDLIEGSIDCSNFISPNGDGINDYWIVKQEYLYDNCNFRIFDAYGNIVMDQTSYQNDWDGNFQSEKLPEGSYFYVIQDLDKLFTYKGTITLIR